MQTWVATFCKCIIHLDFQETVVNMETYFLFLPVFLHDIYARRQHLYLCILLSCLMFVKQCNTRNNSRKVLAIHLPDNSNMSALDPALRGAFVIICRLVLMFFYDFPVGKVNESKKGEKRKNNPCRCFMPSLLLTVLSLSLYFFLVSLISVLIWLSRLSV